MKRPNGMLFNVKGKDGKRWNLVYVKKQDGTYESSANEYIPTDNPLNLDPFVNWLDYIPNKEWMHPIVVITDENGGWRIKPFDTYNQITFEGKTADDKQSYFEVLFRSGVIEKMIDKTLSKYEQMNDEELLNELNISRMDNKWTIEELEKAYSF